MNPDVDIYFAAGCGRCPLGGTPNCKVNHWRHPLEVLRTIVFDCGLTETLKWGVPCYLYETHNVLIISALNDYCALSFFKGALLADTHNILDKPGEHTQAARLIKFKSVQEVLEMELVIKAYIYEAIEVEKANLKVDFKKNPEPIPAVFQRKLDGMPALKAAFDALSPGRKRGYILYFSAPKQAKTQESRVEKYVAKILNGKGIND